MLHTSKSMFSSAHCKAKANEMTCILQNHGHYGTSGFTRCMRKTAED